MVRIAIITGVLAAASIAAAGVIPLDPNSEEPLVDQIKRAIQTPPTTAPTTAQSLMAEVDAQLEAIDREVERLRALGEPGGRRADRLESKLRLLRDRRNGKRPADDDDQPELHLVALRSIAPPSNKALPPAQRRRQFNPMRTPVAVEVQASQRPIVLALCSYGPTHWDVRIDDDANVKRVIVGGYEIQQVNGLPHDVPIEIHTHEGPTRSTNRFYTMGPGSDGHEVALARLRKLASLELATFQLVQQYRGDTIVVGPGSDEWTAQRLLREQRAVYAEAVAHSLARQREALRDVRFQAVRVAPPVPPPAPPAAVQARGGVRVMVGPRRPSAVSLAEFTPAGPIEGSDISLNDRVHHVAVDPNDGAIYAIDNHQAFRLDPKTRVLAPIEFDAPELPRISWCTGITFDTKRRRVVLSAMHTLYAYDPVERKWSGIVDLENVRAFSFTYSAAHDCFYALLAEASDGGGPTRLLRYTADGDADRLIELPRSLVAATYRPDQIPQLIAVGRQLVLIPPPPYPPHAPVRAEAGELPAARMKCHVIDPLTGDVTHSCPLEPQSRAFVKLTDEELATRWRALATNDAAEIQAALPRLAAGEDQTVEYVRANFGPPPPSDPAQVRAWIAQLDREDFAARDKATAALRRLGAAAAPHLRDALAKAPSPESATRINTLLAEIDTDAAAAPKLDRDSLTADLLARIGTPAAIETLSEWSAGAEGAPLTVAARRALEDFARE